MLKTNKLLKGYVLLLRLEKVYDYGLILFI